MPRRTDQLKISNLRTIETMLRKAREVQRTANSDIAVIQAMKLEVELLAMREAAQEAKRGADAAARVSIEEVLAMVYQTLDDLPDMLLRPVVEEYCRRHKIEIPMLAIVAEGA